MEEIETLCSKANDAIEVEKVLSDVIKQRKTIPRKCLELDKQIMKFEFERLENAKILVEENKDREIFWKVIQELKQLKSSEFSVDEDLQKAKKKLEKLYERTSEINAFLKERKNL